jgi:ATP-dependent DNA helicase RecG
VGTHQGGNALIDLARLQQLIAQGEALDREFKSDRRQMSDNDIYEEVVALANSNGGILLIGVEDDGQVTGARPRHGTTTDPIRVQSAIFNNTVPSINTRISLVQHEHGPVLAIEVDPYTEPCATSSGKSLRRAIDSKGKPQTVPFYPNEQRSRRADLGLLDFSAQRLDGTSFDSLDPLEFERCRQTIARLRGDRSLLGLSNEEMAKALRLVETHGKTLVPNVAGLLLLGREEVLREVLPTHEVYFQVLDAQGNVKVNDAFRAPVLRVLEDLQARFAARNEEREVAVGLFRLPIPDYSPEGFRESVNNAVLHRNYTRLGGVYVQWQPDHLLVASPGGLPEGITVDNILVHEPKPRNPRLAEAFKRLGLVEQTGRGVDKIFIGQIRYGRPAPDYSRSDSDGVRVVLQGGQPSLEFAAFVYEQDKQGNPLNLDELLVLNVLHFQRRIDAEEAGRIIQRGDVQARAVLAHLLERGLVEARGERRGRVYILAALLYRRFHMEAEYIRAKGFAPLQQEQMILDYVQSHGSIRRAEAAELCKLTGDQASDRLQEMARKYPQFKLVGRRRGAHYIWDAEQK